MAIAEIFLAAFVKVLFDKLASDVLLHFARREGIHKILEKWKRMLEQIQAVLADAEEKQMTDQRGIKPWLEELQDLAYDLDDILDEFATEAYSRKVMEESRASTSKVRALLPACCSSFSPRSIMFDSMMRSKMDEITKSLEDLLARRVGLGLQIIAAGPSAKAWEKPHSTSVPEPYLYGRDKDKMTIIDLLLSDQSSNSKIGVVPIVGMGGVGKTTLAQMAYNDEMVDKYFEVKAWVCVSEVFDILGVTKAILESVTSPPYDFGTLEKAQVQLKEALARKKFLIVLDDVWNKKYNDWSSLKVSFNDGALGSKVMITTRERDVALIMAGTDKFHSLRELSEDDCWSVFAQHAFENRSRDASQNLVSIGRKIVQKCRGLPLAAKTLGGLLRCKLTEDEWEGVLNSNIWELSYEESEILPALRLSYYYLPSHLKKCFAYCSILPKDYEFEEEELVLLWMAVGFIQKPTGKKQMEDLGREYFRELLSRSFFQPSSSGGSSIFVMHDLINDLAQFVAGEICFRLEDKLKDNEWSKSISKARHSSYTRGYRDGIKKFEAFHEAKNLRTFLPCGSRVQGSSYLTSDVPLDLLPNLRCLRVLSLRGYQIGELSSSIGGLKHVRYLDLSYALIERLPESLSTLYNLQTLVLRNCKNLKKLPTNTGDLINLRHLDVTGVDSLQEMPPKIGNLTNLQKLSNFMVSKNNGSKISDLGNLIHLRGTLCISRLENVVDAEDARGANLDEKQGLDVLLMKWSNVSDGPRNEIVESEVLDMLQPHKKVNQLTISGYHGLRFPNWVGNSLFSNMVSLKFQDCEKCTVLPPLGQLPSLAKLYIQGMKAVENIGLEFYGLGCSNPFPSLEILTFQDMPEWKDWSPLVVETEAQAFACLSKLSIKRCPKLLRKLPSKLLNLKELEIEECPQLVVELVSSPTVPNEVRNTFYFDSLISLSLHDDAISDSFRSSQVSDEAVLEIARYSHLRSPTSLRIGNIQELTCLPSWFFEGLMGLQELTISDCKWLTTLWQNEVRLQHHVPFLRRLVIERCPQLISLFDEEEEGFPYIMMLEYLEIKDCEKLEKLPRRLHTIKSLRELNIYKCPCLISFPNTGLPFMLRTLGIKSCDALLSLSELMMPNNLEKLYVSRCPLLTHLSCSRTGLPHALKELQIWSCEKMESILAEEGMKINCPSLESIQIGSCESLKSLPDVMQNNNLRNLSILQIHGCNSLESFPEAWFSASNLRKLIISNCKKLEVPPLHAYLTSLQVLGVSWCPGAATRLVSYILKEGSSFTNLTSLTIWNVDDMGKPPSEWGLHRLSSLRTLFLRGCCWVSFPEEGMLLPTSLTSLTIWRFPNLEKLSSKGFQNLTSLEELWIIGFPKLEKLSSKGFQNLAFLEKLWILDCPKLVFPEQGLPPSLLYLGITFCPQLKQRCEKGKGQYWPFIAHIPQVQIDYENIFDPKRSYLPQPRSR